MEDKVLRQVIGAVGQNVVSVVSYDFGIKKYMIVLKEVDTKTLDLLADIFGRGKKSIPMIFSSEDVEKMLDVFPLEFLAIQHGTVLHGKDLLADVTFEKEHMRLNLEFELRAKLVQLRMAYIADTTNKKLDFILKDSLPVFTYLGRGLLFMHDDLVSDDKLFEDIKKYYNVNLNFAKTVNELLMNKKTISLQDKKLYVNQIQEALEKLIDKVDEM